MYRLIDTARSWQIFATISSYFEIKNLTKGIYVCWQVCRKEYSNPIQVISSNELLKSFAIAIGFEIFSLLSKKMRNWINYSNYLLPF